MSNWGFGSSAKNCGSPWHWPGKRLFSSGMHKIVKNSNRKQVPDDQRHSKMLSFGFAAGWDSLEAVMGILLYFPGFYFYYT